MWSDFSLNTSTLRIIGTLSEGSGEQPMVICNLPVEVKREEEKIVRKIKAKHDAVLLAHKTE